jgi:hypothetical protein
MWLCQCHLKYRIQATVQKKGQVPETIKSSTPDHDPLGLETQTRAVRGREEHLCFGQGYMGWNQHPCQGRTDPPEERQQNAEEAHRARDAPRAGPSPRKRESVDA